MASYPPKNATYVISSMLMDSTGSVGIESIGFRAEYSRDRAEKTFEDMINDIAAGELFPPSESPILVVMTHRGKMIAATVVS